MNAKLITSLLFLCVFETNVMLAKTKVSIQKAFDKKYISAKAICKGGLELDYSVSNLLKDSLIVVIPAGWRFNSNGGKNDYQDILVTHEELLVLRPKQTKMFDIKGYCCEATKGGPIKGIPYTIGKMADSSLVLLARYLNTHKTDSNTEQYSVWAISDGKETANITSSNDSIAALLRTFVATVKGEPLPWYTLLKRARVSSSGQVSDNPIRFKADINYSVPETCYSYCYIVDANGQKVSEIFGKWLLPENTAYNANFNVAGLKKGEYKLILEGKNQFLFEKSFKI
ncbi:MAG: hypothetical protein U0W65_09040 [Bacteroidia bacterium]